MTRGRYCQLPSPGSITGRSSSITNAFFNTLIPIIPPTLEEELRALKVLEIAPDDLRCAYCGDRSTEWDHLHPIISEQKPTGYITEIANLVPSCGKCNQSKGKSDWRTWMMGNAKLSPRIRRIPDIEQRVAGLQAYEQEFKPQQVHPKAIVPTELWDKHTENWKRVLELMRESQLLANEIRSIVAKAHLEDTRTKNQSEVAV